jgi:hypothetical protein
MSILPGIDVPGATVLSTTGVTSDSLSFVAAATGLTLLGYRVSLPNSGTAARGQIFHGAAVGVIATTTITTFELVTGVNNVQEEFFPAPGIDVSNGISIDWVAGTFDVAVYHKTVT